MTAGGPAGGEAPRYPNVEIIPPPPIAGDRELLIRAVTTGLRKAGEPGAALRYLSAAESAPGYDDVLLLTRTWVTLTGLDAREEQPAVTGTTGLNRLCARLDGFGLNSWAQALAGARPAEQADAARAAARKCDTDLALPGVSEAWAEYASLPAELRGWADQHEAARHAGGERAVAAEGTGWPREYPPKDQQAIIDGCTCPGRRAGRHDMCCEWVLRGAGLLPGGDITPEQVTGQD